MSGSPQSMSSSSRALPPLKPGVPNVPIKSAISVPNTSTSSIGSSHGHGHSHMMPPDLIAVLNSLDTATAIRPYSNNFLGATGGSSSTEKPRHQRQLLDPIEFLNRHYTSEAVLVSHLPLLRESVAQRMDKLDDSISAALQRQSETAEMTRRHVQEAKSSVIALQQRILQVKDKASQSESAVLEITRDMKRLDCAKRHLQRTITTLKQLHMLVNAVEQLRVASTGSSGGGSQMSTSQSFPDFRTAASLIDVIRLLLQHFEPYTAKVEQMRLLSNKVTELQQDLLFNVVRGFRVVAFGAQKTKELEGIVPLAKDGNSTNENFIDQGDLQTDAISQMRVMTPDVMRGGVVLIDALGENVRSIFIRDFCQDQLRGYVEEFQPPSREPPKPEKRVSSFKVLEKPKDQEQTVQQANLEHVEKRFVWFRQLVQRVDSSFPKVFPASWFLQATLARHFLLTTREHLFALLDGPRRDTAASNATVLLKALQKTIIFEKDITIWLQRECEVVFKSDDITSVKEPDSNANAEHKLFTPLIGVASAAFENYMNPYIRLEEQSMDEQLTEALEDRTVDTRGERPVFISSTNLFVYIKGSITRCTALTKGNAFHLLCQAYKDSLRKYALILIGKLPQPTQTTNAVVVGISIPGSFGNKQDTQQAAVYRFPNGEEVTVCHVISTCEYCADTVEALEELIRDTIDDKFKNKVDMMREQEMFHDITAKAIQVLVSGLTSRVENALKSMIATNWASYPAVGEESAYVSSVQEEIEPFVRKVRSLLPTSYFRSFCDKFATSFAELYYETLTRQKKINEAGSQQLQLDISILKTFMLKLPVLEEPPKFGQKAVSTGSTIAPAMYTKMVQKQIGRIEVLLKLVGTPLDMLILNFKGLWAGGSALDFQTVLSLKGLKRAEQAIMLEKFGVDSATALKGATVGVTSATIVSEHVQLLQDQGSTVAAKVNSDLNQMRQKVDDFRKTFRSTSNLK